MKNHEFLDVVAILEAAFQPQDDAKHRLYFQMLEPQPIKDVHTAAIACINDLTTYPTLKDIKDRLPGQLSENDDAEAAWARVVTAADGPRTPYNPHSPSEPTGANLSDRERMAVLQAGGLCAIEQYPERIGFIRRDFLANYKALAHVEIRQPAALPAGYVRGEGVKRLGECLQETPALPPPPRPPNVLPVRQGKRCPITNVPLPPDEDDDA